MRMYPVVAGIPRCAYLCALPPGSVSLLAGRSACEHVVVLTETKHIRRFTTQTTQVGDYLVPPGVFVYVLFYRLHNNAKYWHQPSEFRPERWEALGESAVHRADSHHAGESTGDAQKPESASSSDDAKVYLPFSEGARSCVAQVRRPVLVQVHCTLMVISASRDPLPQNLALMELRVALAVLCSTFTFELAAAMGGPEPGRADEMMALTLHMRGGVWMRCIPRVQG